LEVEGADGKIMLHITDVRETRVKALRGFVSVRTGSRGVWAADGCRVVRMRIYVPEESKISFFSVEDQLRKKPARSRWLGTNKYTAVRTSETTL
jgi:hypothetical protein